MYLQSNYLAPCYIFSCVCSLDYVFLLNFLFRFPDLLLWGALLPLLLGYFDMCSAVIKYIYMPVLIDYIKIFDLPSLFSLFFERAWLLLYQSQKLYLSQNKVLVFQLNLLKFL